MDAKVESLPEACLLLGIDAENKSDAELDVLVWKAMCLRLAAHVELMHEAYERILLGECNTIAEHCQFEVDVAFLTDHFLSRRPLDLLEFLRMSQQPLNT